MNMKRTAYGLLLGASLSTLLAVSWNTTWEAVPAGSDLASDLDTFINDLKAEIRERAEVEHNWGGGGGDNGLHTMGSARGFVSNAAPTDINGGTGALGQYNSAASADGGTALTTDEIGAATRDLGAGRFWVDLDGLDDTAGTTDDRQLNVWDETANAFQPIVARDVQSVSGAAWNPIYNGSFEVTDGTGSAASTTVAAGWTNLNTATIAYDDPTGVSEGEGIAMETTAAGGAAEGASQTLANLKASTTYVFRARARPETAGSDCTLRVTGGSTSPVTDVSATGTNVFETLEVVATTTAVPASLVLSLESNNDTDVCDWDHVTAFERLPVVAQPGIQVCVDTDSSTTDDAYTNSGTWVDALVSCTVTVPGPGYIVEVRGKLVADHDSGNNAALAVRLRENGTTTRAMAVGLAIGNEPGANQFADLVTVPLFFTSVNPTPGTTLTYTMEATPDDDGGPSWDRNLGEEAADVPDAASLLTTLEVRLVPTR